MLLDNSSKVMLMLFYIHIHISVYFGLGTIGFWNANKDTITLNEMKWTWTEAVPVHDDPKHSWT